MGLYFLAFVFCVAMLGAVTMVGVVVAMLIKLHLKRSPGGEEVVSDDFGEPRFISLLITSVPIGLLTLLLLAFLIFHTVMSCQGKTTKQFCKMMRGQPYAKIPNRLNRDGEKMLAADGGKMSGVAGWEFSKGGTTMCCMPKLINPRHK